MRRILLGRRWFVTLALRSSWSMNMLMRSQCCFVSNCRSSSGKSRSSLVARDSLRWSWPSTFDLSDLALSSAHTSSPVDGMSCVTQTWQHWTNATHATSSSLAAVIGLSNNDVTALRSLSPIYSDTTQLNRTSSWVELCRYELGSRNVTQWRHYWIGQSQPPATTAYAAGTLPSCGRHAIKYELNYLN